ncbi:MAG TPA: LysE family translocator [Bacillus sp. (in: firmicutes)]|uniref:LysE family translocator n=1 Tax=Bacillus litorisediminis TaxID=2922713 RepID=UPI001FAC7577|nr:LysE family translocator [Bacillus litorisediminis]HWO76563.1 LysE family translocator [Bacillus sp. (in: firmicutes)]
MFSFIVVVFLLFLIPGPAVIITISQTLQGGKKNGILTALGIGLGDLVHTLAAVLGLSAILMSSALAFELVKYIGAAYLVYLGVQMLIKKTKNKGNFSDKVRPTNLSFRQGFLTEVLNPKTALFFLAFLPQFVQNDGYPVTIQLLILGLTFIIMSIIYTILLAYLTSLIGEKIFSKTQNVWIEKVVGFVYVGLGLRLALETQE